MAVEKGLEGLQYDSRASMRRSWCTDDLFDTSLPERKIVHKDAVQVAQSVDCRGMSRGHRFTGRHQNWPAQSLCFLKADLDECSITSAEGDHLRPLHSWRGD
jgi:hypothetical protein